MIKNQVEDNVILQRYQYKNDITCINISILPRAELHYVWVCLILIFNFLYISCHFKLL
jgi:hypothetical protein